MALPHFEQVIIPMLIDVSENIRYDKLKGSRFIAKFFKLSKDEKDFKPDFDYNPHNCLYRPLIDLSDLCLCYLDSKGLIRGTTKQRKITEDGRNFVNRKNNLQDIEDLPFRWSPEFYTPSFKKDRIEMSAFINDINKAILNKTNKLVEKKVGGKDLPEMLEELLLNCDPYEFEKIVTKVLADLYKGEGEVTRATKDNGIDSIIKVKHSITPQVILVQVKKYANGSISLDTVKAFITSVEKSSFKATAGIFLASCDFSKPSQQFVNENAHQIKLLTLKELIKIMVAEKIGVCFYEKTDGKVFLIPDETYFGRKVTKNNLFHYILGLNYSSLTSGLD
jgi:restriction endonuclease Mrr